MNYDEIAYHAARLGLADDIRNIIYEDFCKRRSHVHELQELVKKVPVRELMDCMIMSESALKMIRVFLIHDLKARENAGSSENQSD